MGDLDREINEEGGSASRTCVGGEPRIPGSTVLYQTDKL
jgi:hypothetical protein